MMCLLPDAMVLYWFILYHAYSLVIFLLSYSYLHLIIQMVGRASRVECSSSVDRRGVSLPEHHHHAHSDEGRGSNIRSSFSSTPLLELVMHYLLSLYWHPHTNWCAYFSHMHRFVSYISIYVFLVCMCHKHMWERGMCEAH